MMKLEMGKKLKRLRKHKNLTLQEVGDMIGYDYSGLSKIERGEREISLDLLVQLCDIYETSLDSLLGIKKEPPKDLKDIGVEWVGFINDMENKDLTPEQIKEYVDIIQKIKENK